jgi:hypothetical protein
MIPLRPDTGDGVLRVGGPRAGWRRTLDRLSALLLTPLLTPWRLAERVRDVPISWAATWAFLQVLTAAILSTALSSWVYLAGKGLALGSIGMDMGQDDLPPDTLAQVVFGLGASLFVWAVLLGLALLLCIVVADAVYQHDRIRFRQAARVTCAASVWFVIWAVAILAVNARRHDELTRPEAAIRAYAQLRQQGFQGSSAIGPGPIHSEPLAGHARLRSLALLFPVIWAIGLPRSGMRAPRRWLAAVGSIGLWWVLCVCVVRLLPWITIDALLG